MSEEIDKQKFVNELKESAEKCEKRIEEVLKRIGWTKEHLVAKRKAQNQRPATSIDRSTEESSSTAQSSHSTEVKGEDLSSLYELNALADRNKDLATTFTDLNKLKRDLKRRRMKHRTTKAAPLTYTEEIRELINNLTEMEQNKRRKT